MATCFPEVVVKQDKASWFWEFPNGSQIWFGGLDEKERTEKVLGNEYATIFLNECSQIGLAARNTVITRLAQNVGLALKCYLDMNPPVVTHWSHRLFIEKREAAPPYGKLQHAESYAALQMNPADNAANLPTSYLTELQSLPPRERLRFWEGRFGAIGENALELIETYRKSVRPDLQRVVVSVDPSGTKGGEDGAIMSASSWSGLASMAPNPIVATINHERMPVLLTREEEFDTWLRGSPDEAFALAREYPPEQMRIVQEGLDKEDLLRAA